MKREEPAGTGSPTLTDSLSAPRDDPDDGKLARISKEWNELGFDPWRSEHFPLEEDQEDCFASVPALPLGSSSKGSSSRGNSSVGMGRVHPSTPAVNRFLRSHGRESSTVSIVERALWATRLAAIEGLIELPHVPCRELELAHPPPSHVSTAAFASSSLASGTASPVHPSFLRARSPHPGAK